MPTPTRKTRSATQTKTVLLMSEARIFQVLVNDSMGKQHSVPVYVSGPEIYTATSLDALFDSNRRQKAPMWMVEQLRDLPDTQKFDYKGRRVAAKYNDERDFTGPLAKATATVQEPQVATPVGTQDDDVSGVISA